MKGKNIKVSELMIVKQIVKEKVNYGKRKTNSSNRYCD